ncbi:hypothetical protein BDY19DRAFT_941257 [Irpex rosettiformis]|uniref:Uncharacterized protein n=1 Tax=Irpex rosettiformis TaxID=378272 RepID=A0ACB8U661_9APHY|nr:hypothetical protein BDY19DRAFT_941257 [Irpex rosettiformis]
MAANTESFPALTGFYRFLFLYLEPALTALPCLLIWTLPGAAWFHHGLIQDDRPSPSSTIIPDARTHMAILQLGNCYLLLGMLSSLVFRAVRDALPGNPVAQERIIGASLFAMAVADLTHIIATLVGLPSDLRYAVGHWNATTHGNVTFVVFLLVSRTAWFLGIGRKSYWFCKSKATVRKDD